MDVYDIFSDKYMGNRCKKCGQELDRSARLARRSILKRNMDSKYLGWCTSCANHHENEELRKETEKILKKL